MGAGGAGRVAWGVAVSAPTTYRGVVAPADSVPTRLPENDSDAPRRVLLLAAPAGGDAEPDGDAGDRLDAAGYPHATLPAAGPAPLDGDGADAVARWAAAVDRI